MSTPQEPRRLFEDEANRSLAQALDVVRRDQPSAAQIEALATAIERVALVSVAAATTKTFAAGGKVALFKAGAALCVVGVCAWVALKQIKPPPEEHALQVATPIESAARAITRQSPTTAPRASGDARTASVAAETIGREVAIETTDSKAVAMLEPAAAPTAPSSSATPATRTRKAPRVAHAVPETAPHATVMDQASSVALPHDTSTAAAPRASGEVELLSAAQRALRRAPSQALTLAREHARRFPAGAFAEERDAVEIEALALLGRIDDARARTNAFMHDYPTSPHRRRLVQLLTATP